MTRTANVRHATVMTKDNVRHATHMVAPYAGTARDTAAHYAGQARRRLAPKVSSAAHQARKAARSQYGTRVAPVVAQARDAVPPKIATAVGAAARQTRRRARQATRYAAPRMGQAVVAARTATDPVREEAAARSVAALAALRGQVSAKQIEKLARRNVRRARRGRFTRRLTMLGALVGGGTAAWLWWSRQTSPQWLVEPGAAADMDVIGSDGPPNPGPRAPHGGGEEPEAGL